MGLVRQRQLKHAFSGPCNILCSHWQCSSLPPASPPSSPPTCPPTLPPDFCDWSCYSPCSSCCSSSRSPSGSWYWGYWGGAWSCRSDRVPGQPSQNSSEFQQYWDTSQPGQQEEMRRIYHILTS